MSCIWIQVRKLYVHAIELNGVTCSLSTVKKAPVEDSDLPEVDQNTNKTLRQRQAALAAKAKWTSQQHFASLFYSPMWTLTSVYPPITVYLLRHHRKLYIFLKLTFGILLSEHKIHLFYCDVYFLDGGDSRDFHFIAISFRGVVVSMCYSLSSCLPGRWWHIIFAIIK